MKYGAFRRNGVFVRFEILFDTRAGAERWIERYRDPATWEVFEVHEKIAPHLSPHWVYSLPTEGS